MKLIFATALLWVGILLSETHAQVPQSSRSPLTDTLNILYQEEILVKVASPELHKLKHQRVYQDLLDQFKSHLKSVENQVPDYDIFRITYFKDLNLKIEEVEGIVKYQIENGNTTSVNYQNEAILQDKNLKITIRFNKLDEILDTDYKSMIKEALLKLGRKKVRLRNLYFSQEYFYSSSMNKMVKGYKKTKFINRIGLVPHASIGLYKNNPIYEFDLGIGYIFGNKNKKLLFLYYGNLYRYEEETSTHQHINIVGFGYKPFDFVSVHYSFSPNSLHDETYPDLGGRVTMTYHFRKLTSVSIHQYFEGDTDISFPSVSVGIGF